MIRSKSKCEKSNHLCTRFEPASRKWIFSSSEFEAEWGSILFGYNISILYCMNFVLLLLEQQNIRTLHFVFVTPLSSSDIHLVTCIGIVLLLNIRFALLFAFVILSSFLFFNFGNFVVLQIFGATKRERERDRSIVNVSPKWCPLRNALLTPKEEEEEVEKKIYNRLILYG